LAQLNSYGSVMACHEELTWL